MLIYLNMEFLGENIEVWSKETILSLLTLMGGHLEKYHLFPTLIHPSHMHLITDMTAMNKVYVYLKHIEYEIGRTLHTLRNTLSVSGGDIVLSFKLLGGRPYVILEVRKNDVEVQTSPMEILPSKRNNIPDPKTIGGGSRISFQSMYLND